MIVDDKAVIPSNWSRKVIIAHDEIAYKLSNHIERCFGQMKHVRRFATRYKRWIAHV